MGSELPEATGQVAADVDSSLAPCHFLAMGLQSPHCKMRWAQHPTSSGARGTRGIANAQVRPGMGKGTHILQVQWVYHGPQHLFNVKDGTCPLVTWTTLVSQSHWKEAVLFQGILLMAPP